MNNMTKIYKYPLRDGEIVELPERWVFRHLASQGSSIMLWAQVYPAMTKTIKNKVYVYGTGQEIDTMGGKYFLGTCFQGPFAWHVFLGTVWEIT